jgi:diguanylate cyclase (GGDEF)-like protein/putative nucleotidyltransferase with HDIG domain
MVKETTRERLHRLASRAFFRTIVLAGIGTLLYSGYDLYRHPTDWRWIILAGLCLLTSSFNIKIPGANSKMSISDTFYFTNLIVYGTSAGVITGALDGLLSSVRAQSRNRRLEYAAFNMSTMACSAMVGGWLFFFMLGQGPLSQQSPISYRQIMFPAALLGFVQYLLNSGTVAAIVALEARKSFYSVWKESFLWTSVTYLAGAAIAALAAVNFRIVGPEMLGVIVPTIVAIYYTYKVYLDKVLELNKVYLNTVESLAMAIDAKDQITHGHVRRVQIFARGLARAGGMRDEESLRWMEAAALLHDIGKLAIPEYILNKPGKLTQSEFNKVMEHSVVGGEILSSINFPYDVAKDVRHHHENWDGSGYPDGIRGTDIPLGARILAIVDSYDALTSDRPYRAALSRDEAMAIIHSKAGTFFDPELVRKFDGILDALLAQATAVESQLESAMGARAVHKVKDLPAEKLGVQAKTPRVFQNIVSTHREVSALYDLAQMLSTTLNREETLAVIASKIGKLIPSTTCVIYLVSPEKGTITAEHASGKNVAAFAGHSMEMGQNLSGWVAANNHPAVNADPVFDTLALRPFLEVDLKNALVYPLYSQTACLGVISLYVGKDVTFTEDHVRIMEVVAKQAATAIQNAIKYEETQVEALTDHLTSLPNSRYLEVYFDREMEKARRFQFPLAIVAMDLDGFKNVNDAFGHHVGDRMLVEVAKVLNRNIRASDVVIRHGGDEFLAVISQATREEVSLLANRVQREVEEIRLDLGTGELARIGISVGTAAFPEDGDSLEILLKTADAAMYQNKRCRANSYEKARRTFQLVQGAKDQTAS